MAVNVEGSFFCAREAAKDMMRREAPGSIIMIGSMSGAAVNIPQPQAPYNASKVCGFVSYWRKDWRSEQDLTKSW